MDEMCRILRKHKVKMTPSVRMKLKDIDHLLDEDYETVKVKFTETVTVEVEEEPLRNRRDWKRSKLGPRTERREISVEKDPKGLVSRLIQGARCAQKD